MRAPIIERGQWKKDPFIVPAFDQERAFDLAHRVIAFAIEILRERGAARIAKLLVAIEQSHDAQSRTIAQLKLLVLISLLNIALAREQQHDARGLPTHASDC